MDHVHIPRRASRHHLFRAHRPRNLTDQRPHPATPAIDQHPLPQSGPDPALDAHLQRRLPARAQPSRLRHVHPIRQHRHRIGTHHHELRQRARAAPQRLPRLHRDRPEDAGARLLEMARRDARPGQDHRPREIKFRDASRRGRVVDEQVDAQAQDEERARVERRVRDAD